MMVRLIRSAVALLIAVALIGAPAMQAAAAMPCGMTAATSAADHPPGSDHGPVSSPCTDKMPGCADMLGCGIGASLQAPAPVLMAQPAWTLVAYWPVTEQLNGLSVQPDLGPPITI